MRIGHGYDVHCLVADRALVLGGVTIPHRLGLAGHSDADVVLHAICDALLGAMGAGDIGQHFPDSDPSLKDIDSRVLLRKVVQMMFKQNYSLCNVDVTIAAQAPKLAGFLSDMRLNIASDLECDISHVNLKATTTEKLGFVGREEGIAAHAVCLLEEKT